MSLTLPKSCLIKTKKHRAERKEVARSGKNWAEIAVAQDRRSRQINWLAEQYKLTVIRRTKRIPESQRFIISGVQSPTKNYQACKNVGQCYEYWGKRKKLIWVGPDAGRSSQNLQSCCYIFKELRKIFSSEKYYLIQSTHSVTQNGKELRSMNLAQELPFPVLDCMFSCESTSI